MQWQPRMLPDTSQIYKTYPILSTCQTQHDKENHQPVLHINAQHMKCNFECGWTSCTLETTLHTLCTLWCLQARAQQPMQLQKLSETYLLISCAHNLLCDTCALISEPCTLDVLASNCDILYGRVEPAWTVLLYIGQDASCLVHHFSFLQQFRQFRAPATANNMDVKMPRYNITIGCLPSFPPPHPHPRPTAWCPTVTE